MALENDSKTNSPNVGMRGNPQDLPTLKSSVGISTLSQTPDFVGAMNDLATTPTALGTLASKASVGASNAMMDSLGYELGKDPHGELLPSITDADKRFSDAYSNQAQATLGLQADKMMGDAQLELSKANQLTPEMIGSYTENMAKAAQQITSLAPSTVKGALENGIASSIQRTSLQLNQKMIGQQKERAKDQANLYAQNMTKDIYENAMSGNIDAAKSQYQDSVSINAKRRANGEISATQEAASNSANKQTLLTGYYASQALSAKKDGKMDEFLSGMANNKPDGITYLDWQAVGKNVLGVVSGQEALERRDQSLNAAQFDLAILENRVTADTIEELRQKQTPEQFARSMGKYVASQSKSTSQDEALEALNLGSAVSMADATSKTINAKFNQMTQDKIQSSINSGKGEISQIEAKTEIANGAAAPIPQFVSELNNMAISGNAALMMQASNAYRVLGGLKAPIDRTSQAMLFGFDSQIQQGRTPEEAASIMKENIGTKSNEQIEALDNQWKQFKSENLKTFDDQVRFAKKLMDIPWRADVPNLPALTLQANKAFESNLKLLGGDVEAAKAMTSHNLEQSYGTTYTNGRKEYTYLPIEKFMGIEDGSASGIIQNEMVQQVIPQLEATKKAFDEGRNDFYYRVQDRPSFESAMAARQEMAQLNSKTSKGNLPEADYVKFNEKMNSLQSVINQYKENKPVKIEKVWATGTVEEFEMNIQASPSMGLGVNSATPIAGAYDISIRTKGGRLGPIIGVDNLTSGNIVMRPDLNKLRAQYFAINGLLGSQDEYNEEWFKAYKQKPKKITDEQRIEQFLQDEG